jgi:hypothetical protein
MKKHISSTIIAVAIAIVAYSGCKKKDDNASKPQAKIAYAIYGIGVFDKTDSPKASEWLNRGEMVTIMETVSIPNAKDPSKSKTWAKSLEPKAFVVLRPLEVFNINQASGKKLATVPPGQVGFVAEEKADWAKVRFGYKIYEQWAFNPESAKWVDQKWAQIDGVSYDPTAIGQGVELETALRKFYDADATKKAAGKKELEAIISDAKSQFIDVAQRALAGEGAGNEAKPAENVPAESTPAPADGK